MLFLHWIKNYEQLDYGKWEGEESETHSQWLYFQETGMVPVEFFSRKWNFILCVIFH